MKDAAFSLLRELTEAHGAPGHEDGPRAVFARELAPLGPLTTDRLGSVLCEVTGPAGARSGPRLMVTAHLDEVGFMIHSITEAGFLTLVPLGGWWTHTLLAQRLRVRTRTGREHLGIVTSTPPHFLSETEKTKVLGMEQLYVDVGASSRRHAEETLGIRPGDVAVPDSACTPLSEPDLLCAKAFDNRVGVAVTIAALQQLAAASYPAPGQLLGVATVQEEVGCRGAETAAALARPDVALVIEGTPADDTPGYPASVRQAVLGKGPQIRVMDPTALMNPRLVQFVSEVATEKNIPYQLAVRRTGGTDARAFTTAGLGVPSVVIGVPARYIHTHNSVIHLDDYLATVALVVEVVRRLDAATVEGLTDFLA
jgi:endoglucanase